MDELFSIMDRLFEGRELTRGPFFPSTVTHRQRRFSVETIAPNPDYL